MLKPRREGRFKKDVKICIKRGYDMELMKAIIRTLSIPELLEEKYRTHPLTGEYSGYDECHITPDWLLIYKQTETELLLARPACALFSVSRTESLPSGEGLPYSFS